MGQLTPNGKVPPEEFDDDVDGDSLEWYRELIEACEDNVDLTGCTPDVGF